MMSYPTVIHFLYGDDPGLDGTPGDYYEDDDDDIETGIITDWLRDYLTKTLVFRFSQYLDFTLLFRKNKILNSENSGIHNFKKLGR